MSPVEETNMREKIIEENMKIKDVGEQSVTNKPEQ